MEESMSATAIWETQASEPLEITAQADEASESSMARNSVAALQELVLRLLGEVQCINDANPLSIESGFDFYDEVSRFEIDLIKRALLQTGGHQVQAARLLNLKVTTLNSKIKHYGINPTGLASIFPIVETGLHEERKTA
jgi:transcriptional regulator with GAF, ATPase, and Fis domain